MGDTSLTDYDSVYMVYLTCCTACKCAEKRGSLDDLKRHLPTSNVLQFCDLWLLQLVWNVCIVPLSSSSTSYQAYLETVLHGSCSSDDLLLKNHLSWQSSVHCDQSYIVLLLLSCLKKICPSVRQISFRPFCWWGLLCLCCQSHSIVE